MSASSWGWSGDRRHRAVVAISASELDAGAREKIRAAHGGLVAMIVEALGDIGHEQPRWPRCFFRESWTRPCGGSRSGAAEDPGVITEAAVAWRSRGVRAAEFLRASPVAVFRYCVGRCRSGGMPFVWGGTEASLEGWRPLRTYVRRLSCRSPTKRSPTCGHSRSPASRRCLPTAGSPMVVPLAFEYDGTYFWVGGSGAAVAGTRKFRNVRAGHHEVALVIDDLVSLDPFVARGVRGLRPRGRAGRACGDGRPGLYTRITPTVSWSWNMEGRRWARRSGTRVAAVGP